MTKSILDLCRLLPDSEPEIRKRWAEFNVEVAEKVMRLNRSDYAYKDTDGREQYFATDSAAPDYIDTIADAKAATDAVCAMGYRLEILYSGGRWTVEFYRLPTKNTVISAEVFASTEELARSAACVLAAEAMKEKR